MPQETGVLFGGKELQESLNIQEDLGREKARISERMKGAKTHLELLNIMSQETVKLQAKCLCWGNFPANHT